MNTIEYLDKAKSEKGIPSDYALAKALGIRSSAISNYRSGKSQMDDNVARKIAEIIGVHAGIVMLDMHRERAQTAEEAGIWQEIAKGFLSLLLPAKIGASA